MRAQRDRNEADRILSPMTRQVACRIIDAEMKFRFLRAIGNARGEYRGRDLFPECNPIAFLLVALDAQKILRQGLVKGGFLRRKKRNEGVMRCLRHSRDGRNWMRGRVDSGVALISAQNRIDCVEDRDVNNGHGTAGAAGAELFAKHTIFARGQPGCDPSRCRVDGDLVPAMHHVGGGFGILLAEAEGWR